jgi:uncharacterized protein with FMN-binding domain
MNQRPTSLARRLLPAVAMTTAASGLVALLDQPSSGAAVGRVDDTSASVPDQGGGAVVSQPPVVSSTVPTAAPTAVPPTVRTASPATLPPSVPVVVPGSTTATKCTGKTVDGPTVDTRWGPVQVVAIVSNSGRICDVDAIQSPDSHGRSVAINDYALPILHTEVIHAQSANINSISGATITSRAYERSLQSILDGVG